MGTVQPVRELNLAIKTKPACSDLCLTPVNMTRMLWWGPITTALGLLSWWSHCWAALHVRVSPALDHLKLCEMSSQIKPFCSYHFHFSVLAVQGFSRGDFISVAALFIQMLMFAATAQLTLPNCSQHHWSSSLDSFQHQHRVVSLRWKMGPKTCVAFGTKFRSLLFQGKGHVWGWDGMSDKGMGRDGWKK